jgi:hypothetical protein
VLLPGNPDGVAQNLIDRISGPMNFALVLDVAYQIIALRFVYPAEAIIVAFAVVIAPYLIVRGLVTGLAAKK